MGKILALALTMLFTAMPARAAEPKCKNGTAGILTVANMYEVTEQSGRPALIVLTPSYSTHGFQWLLSIARADNAPVAVGVEGTQLKLLLNVRPGLSRIGGRVAGTNERVYVYPDDAGDGAD